MRIRKKNYVYVHVHERERFIISVDWATKGFMDVLQTKLPYVLLLNHQMEQVAMEFSATTRLNYMEQTELMKLSWENVDSRGLCWIDFESKEGMESTRPTDLAELLYLTHMKHAMRTPFYPKLNNNYLFLSEAGSPVHKVYFRQWHDFYDLLRQYMMRELNQLGKRKSLFGREKKSIYPPIPLEIIVELSKYIQEGVIFSFVDIIETRWCYEIAFWVMEGYHHEVDLFEAFSRDKKKVPSVSLVLSKKSGMWKLAESSA